jgi:hypothetical protein
VVRGVLCCPVRSRSVAPRVAPLRVATRPLSPAASIALPLTHNLESSPLAKADSRTGGLRTHTRLASRMTMAHSLRWPIPALSRGNDDHATRTEAPAVRCPGAVRLDRRR